MLFFSYIVEEVINIIKLFMQLFYYVCMNFHVSYALCISYFQNMFWVSFHLKLILLLWLNI
jgi:hypothetical protein